MVMDTSLVSNLKQEGLSIREIARRTGIPKSTVLELLRREKRAKQQNRKTLEMETARANIRRCLDRGEVCQARDYALRVLEHNPAFNDALNQSDDEFGEALQTLSKEDSRALFFAINGWLNWMRFNFAGNPRSTVGLPKVLMMKDRLLELDETFNYGGPHILEAAYNASRPLSMGGDPDKAKYHFERAFEISESKFLLWHYLYAKYYAVQNMDRKLFETTLDHVLTAPVDLLPEKRFVNEAVKLKARHLLSRADQLFNCEDPEMAVFSYIVPDRNH